MIEIIRRILWRILGFDYQTMLDKNDFTLLKNDKHVFIGSNTYDNGAKVWRWTTAKIRIGNYCSIAHNVNFIVDEGFHFGSGITSFPLLNSLKNNEDSFLEEKTNILKELKQKSEIVIGNDVWIGMGALIMPGVVVGNGVTIAANAVVTKSIPDYAVVAGVPAKIIKQKFNDEEIVKLNRIAWWNWSQNKIKKNIKDFYINPENFINKYSK